MQLDLTIFSLLAVLVVGIGFGYFLRDKKRFDISKVTFGVIIMLIFSLGFRIGSDNVLLAAMPTIGVNAIVIMLLAVFFSTVFLKLAMKLVRLE